MKRLLDFSIAFLGLLILSPLFLVVMFLVWIQDFHSPFYVATRMGKNEKPFSMVKLRSMIINADKSGVDSTSSADKRITGIGRFIRSYKLDEISQLWNVFIGDMSLVGPRPNVKRETDLYTNEEKQLLSVKPGITDFSSIVFSDEGEILKDSIDPDLDYNQLIRPWKSRLGLFYIEQQSISLDIQLIFLTALAIISREKALTQVTELLQKLQAPTTLVTISMRNETLTPAAPPGASEIVTNRNI